MPSERVELSIFGSKPNVIVPSTAKALILAVSFPNEGITPKLYRNMLNELFPFIRLMVEETKTFRFIRRVGLVSKHPES